MKPSEMASCGSLEECRKVEKNGEKKIKGKGKEKGGKRKKRKGKGKY